MSTNNVSDDFSEDASVPSPSTSDSNKTKTNNAIQEVLKELRVAKAKKVASLLDGVNECPNKSTQNKRNEAESSRGSRKKSPENNEVNAASVSNNTLKTEHCQNQRKSPHTKKNSDSRPYKCTFCIKSFARRDTLTEHLRTHTKEKPFSCKFCAMKFPTQSTRRKHEDTHVGEKRYQCSHCGLLFSGKSSLNYHLMVHSGERPFKCEYCNKGFIHNSHLRRHIRVHTGEKPFSCKHCGLKFVRSSSLQNHVRKHTGEILFTCQHCNKKFHIKETFDYHLKSHAGIKPYSCSICGWSFIKNSHLKRHMRTHSKTRSNSSSSDHSTKDNTQPKDDDDGTEKLSTEVSVNDMGSNKIDAQKNNFRAARRWSYTCTYCPKQFAHKRSLENHLKYHDVIQNSMESTVPSSSEYILPNSIDEDSIAKMEEGVPPNDSADDDLINQNDLGAQFLCDIDMG